jgi:hypothetical protein
MQLLQRVKMVNIWKFICENHKPLNFLWGVIVLIVIGLWTVFGNHTEKTSVVPSGNNATASSASIAAGNNSGSMTQNNYYGVQPVEEKPLLSMDIVYDLNEKDPYKAKFRIKNNGKTFLANVKAEINNFELLTKNNTQLKLGNGVIKGDPRYEIGNIEAGEERIVLVDNLVHFSGNNGSSLFMLSGDKLEDLKSTKLCIKLSYSWKYPADGKLQDGERLFGFILDNTQSINGWLQRDYICLKKEQATEHQE